MSYSQTLHESPEGWPWDRPTGLPASIRDVVSNLDRAKRHLRLAAADLPVELLWRRIGPDVCAAGNLLMHVRGSEHQWIGHKIGGLPLRRDRDLEFSSRGGPSLAALLAAIEETSTESGRVLSSLGEEQVRTFRSEGEGLAIPFILHYTAQHMALHLGQLVVVREFLQPGYRLEEAILRDNAGR